MQTLTSTAPSRPSTPPPDADPLVLVRRLVAARAGQRLPGERDLARQLAITRPRLRAILRTLHNEGLIETRQGSGTYAVDFASPTRPLRQVVLLIDAALKWGDDPFFSLLMERLQASLQANGIRCLFERTTGDTLPPFLGDGAITVGLAGAALLTQHRSDDAPLVALMPGGGAGVLRRASVFNLDDRAAGQAAAEMLIMRGCQTLVFVGRTAIPASAERLAGAQGAADAARIALRYDECRLNYAAGLHRGRALSLPDAPGTVGIIAANDWLAVGLRAGLAGRPGAGADTLPLVSFDGLPLARDPALGIVSLAVPVDTIAHDAVTELVRLQRPGAGGRRVSYSLGQVATMQDER